MTMKFAGDRWGRPFDALTATLHYLEIGCSDPAASAAFYQRAMGYVSTQQGEALIAEAPGRCLILIPGAPKSLVSAGFAVPDTDELNRLRDRLDTANWPYHLGATKLFHEALTLQDPDGNTFAFGLP